MKFPIGLELNTQGQKDFQKRLEIKEQQLKELEEDIAFLEEKEHYINIIKDLV